ncbi:MAG TPA: biotin/lipoyl-binding protein, partial [Candidatus Limisoma intestinavium]|nr:biotin/lipoyl-binding protein [Candidatus Limisoma intestinavium]
MDIQLKKKRLPNTKKAATVAIAAIGIAGIATWIWNSNKKTTTRIDRDAVTIATVEAGKFNDYIRIVGIVQPSNSIQISAEEGGIVEQKFIEEGATVHAGDPILQLRNSTLDLEIMNAEAELAEKQNFLRNTQVTMEQDR